MQPSNYGYQYQQPQQSNQNIPNWDRPAMVSNSGLSIKPQQGPRYELPARIVASMEEITVGEVPTDGSVALFLSADKTKVFAKAWNNRGYIDDAVFVREEVTTNQSSQMQPLDLTPIMEKLEAMEQSLNALKKKKTYYNSKPKGGTE